MEALAKNTNTRKLTGGWVESLTKLDNEKVLLKLRSENRIISLTVDNSALPEDEITPQSVVVIYGTDFNDVSTIELLHKAAPLPIDLENPNYEDLAYRHLHIRTPLIRAAAMFRHHVLRYARQYLDGLGFFNIQTPILTEASCVCSGDVFTFPYYGKKVATLIQSPWMYADALTSGVEKVYTLNPSFRREGTETNIHLVEIWQLQVDMTWATNEDIMSIEEGLIQHIAKNVYENNQDVYELAGLSSEHLPSFLKPFKRISYDQSVAMLNKLGYDFKYGDDYSQEQSDALSAQFDRPYFVTDYPISLKNFWFPKDPETGITPSNDLFAHTGHGEIIGGGERITNPDGLEENLEKFGHDLDEFDWFVDIRRHGCSPHAGFSIGFDRLVAMIMGVDDIRKATLFPRMPHGILKP